MSLLLLITRPESSTNSQFQTSNPQWSKGFTALLTPRNQPRLRSQLFHPIRKIDLIQRILEWRYTKWRLRKSKNLQLKLSGSSILTWIRPFWPLSCNSRENSGKSSIMIAALRMKLRVVKPTILIWTAHWWQDLSWKVPFKSKKSLHLAPELWLVSSATSITSSTNLIQDWSQGFLWPKLI